LNGVDLFDGRFTEIRLNFVDFRVIGFVEVRKMPIFILAIIFDELAPFGRDFDGFVV
jgi:hypothetical protein